MIHVAVGVIFDGDGRVLVARRPNHLHQGGLWEFPGGKLESGESTDLALARELHEELGIQVEVARPFLKVRHQYHDRVVLLDVWTVHSFSGDPIGVEGQDIQWVTPEALPAFDFPAANRPIVSAIRLPDRYAILDQMENDSALLQSRVAHLLELGIELIQLRLKSLPNDVQVKLARSVVPLSHAAGVKVLLNGTPELAMDAGADGVHLSAQRAGQFQTRPIDDAFLLGVSCHDQTELQQALKIGADFAVLGPVMPTGTHPRAVPLGWEQFRLHVIESGLPVFALGGMRPADIPVARANGAIGIAAIRGFSAP